MAAAPELEAVRRMRLKESGASMHDELVRAVGLLVENKPERPLDMLTGHLMAARAGTMVPPAGLGNVLPSERAEKDGPSVPATVDVRALQAFVELVYPPKAKKVRVDEFGVEIDPADLEEGEEQEEEEEEEEPEPNEGTVPNLFDQMALLACAGCGFDEEKTHQLYVSVRKLVEKEPLESVRFWGFITGKEKNYYILEAEYKEDARPRAEYLPPEEDEEGDGAEGDGDEEEADDLEPFDPEEPAEEDEEAPKPLEEVPPEDESGINQHRYFVCNDLSESWVPLPDVTPKQIEVARCIRRFFSGHLDAPVPCHPAFPGLEKEFLRAQICRISASTHLAPRTLYRIEGAEEPDLDDPDYEPEPVDYAPHAELSALEEREEVDPIRAESLLKAENWVHTTPYILHELHRCTLLEEPAEEEEEEELDEDGNPIPQPPKKEPEHHPPLLTPVAEDESFDSQGRKVPAWALRVCEAPFGSDGQYLACASSLRWPGARCLFRASQGSAESGTTTTLNVYFGDGQKFQYGTYAHVRPRVLAEEPAPNPPGEQLDPSPEREERFKEPRPPTPENKHGEGEESEEEVEDEEE